MSDMLFDNIYCDNRVGSALFILFAQRVGNIVRHYDGDNVAWQKTWSLFDLRNDRSDAGNIRDLLLRLGH